MWHSLSRHAAESAWLGKRLPLQVPCVLMREQRELEHWGSGARAARGGTKVFARETHTCIPEAGAAGT